MASVKTMDCFPLRQVPTRHQRNTDVMSVHELEVQWGEKIFPAFLKNRQMGTCWESFPLGDLSELYRGEEEGQALVQSMWWRNDTLL